MPFTFISCTITGGMTTMLHTDLVISLDTKCGPENVHMTVLVLVQLCYHTFLLPLRAQAGTLPEG